MIERTKAEGLDEFEGVVRGVALEPSSNPNIEGMQYHITIEPKDKTILKASKTGFFHEWIRMTANATDDSVPEGSVLDRFLQELVTADKDTKKCSGVSEALNMMIGNTYLFKKKTLGKAYGGFEAHSYWTPVQKLK
jgi:hypothetical protein